MLEFEDLDANYEFGESKKKSISTKIKVLTLFLIFVLLILLLAKNSYRFDMLNTAIIPVITVCNPLYKFDSRDSEAIMIENAGEVLEDNLEKFEELEGFKKGYIESRSVTQEGKRIPEIILEFKDIAKIEKDIPNKVCGFNVTVTYK